MRAFTCNYNFLHYDTKRGTNPHLERFGAKFKGNALVFGQRIRYLPSAKGELDAMSKFDSKLRDGIFVGYRMHSGGTWSGQYLVLDATRFQEQRPDHGHLAYDHGVNEIYVPGTATDDNQGPLQLPVATGLWLEHGTDRSIDQRQSLRTTEEEALPTSIRPSDDNGDDPHDSTAGGHDGDADASSPDDLQSDQSPLPALKDTWEMQGDYLVRIHRIPRRTLFAP